MLNRSTYPDPGNTEVQRVAVERKQAEVWLNSNESMVMLKMSECSISGFIERFRSQISDVHIEFLEDKTKVQVNLKNE